MQDQGGSLSKVLAIGILVTGCGGSTRAESPTIIDNGDGGASPDVDRDSEGGSVDAEIPKLDFNDIGKAQLISKRFVFTEGPVWDTANQALFFTDIDGDAIYRLTPPDTVDVVLSPAGHANGLALDPEGRLVVAGFENRDVWRTGGSEPFRLADNYNGKKLNAPDDVVVRSDGTIYFTDPTYGINGTNGPVVRPDLDFMGVFRISPDGTLSLEDATTNAPNGASIAPDEHTLYVSYTSTSEIGAFDIDESGALANKRSFAGNLSVPDGMTVDRGGNVYVAVVDGIAVIDPTGVRLGTIPLPQWASNCAFGGADQKTLYITARNLVGTKSASLYRIDDMPIAGIPGQP